MKSRWLDNGKVFSYVFALACGLYIAVSIWQLVGLGVTKVFKHGRKTTKWHTDEVTEKRVHGF